MNINHNYTWFTHRPKRFRRQRKKKRNLSKTSKWNISVKANYLRLSKFVFEIINIYIYILHDAFCRLYFDLIFLWISAIYIMYGLTGNIQKRVVILPAVSFLLPLRFKSAVDFAFCLNQVEFYTKNIAQKFEEDVGGCAMLNNSCMIILCIFMHRLQPMLANFFWSFWSFWIFSKKSMFLWPKVWIQNSRTLKCVTILTVLRPAKVALTTVFEILFTNSAAIF